MTRSAAGTARRHLDTAVYSRGKPSTCVIRGAEARAPGPGGDGGHMPAVPSPSSALSGEGDAVAGAASPPSRSHHGLGGCGCRWWAAPSHARAGVCSVCAHKVPSTGAGSEPTGGGVSASVSATSSASRGGVSASVSASRGSGWRGASAAARGGSDAWPPQSPRVIAPITRLEQ